MTEPTRFPLAWPPGRPRRAPAARKEGKFITVDYSSKWRSNKPITIAQAMRRLTDEVERLGGRYPLLSSNLELRLDGQPRSDARRPADPGVCLYFSLDGKPMALACDRYTTAEQNIAAVAAHIDAVRAIERHGVATAAETLQAFEALPAPKTWWEKLGFAIAPTRADAINERFRELAAKNHPDRGGTHEAMAELTRARDDGLRSISEAA